MLASSMDFSQYLTHLREKSGLTKRQLASMVDVTATYIGNLEYRRNRAPKHEICEKIAKALKLSEIQERKFFELAFSERHGEDFLGFQESLNIRETINTSEIKIPVVSWARGGDEAIDVKPVQDFAGKTIEFKNCQAIEIIGDSMSPVAYNGHKIIYSESKMINEGDLVYIRLKDGNNYFKRYHKDRHNNLITLQPVNTSSHYGPRNIKEKDIEFIYKVVGVCYE